MEESTFTNSKLLEQTKLELEEKSEALALKEKKYNLLIKMHKDSKEKHLNEITSARDENESKMNVLEDKYSRMISDFEKKKVEELFNLNEKYLRELKEREESEASLLREITKLRSLNSELITEKNADAEKNSFQVSL